MDGARHHRKLPPPSHDNLLEPVTRWRPERKARLLQGIQNGLITMAEARQAHGLSTDELDRWWQTWQREGLRGLKITTRHTVDA